MHEHVRAFFHRRARSLELGCMHGHANLVRMTLFDCRADDRPEAVRARFDVYRRQTAPILPYYSARGILRRVDGMADIDTVTRQIDKILGSA